MKFEEIILIVVETKWRGNLKFLSGHSCKGFLVSNEKGIRFSWKCDLSSDNNDNGFRLFYTHGA